MVMPSRSGVLRVAGGAQRRRQHEEQQHADAEHEVDAEERQRLGPHFGRGVDQREQERRREVADQRQHGEHPDRGDERLVDDAVDLVVIAGAGEARHQHRLAGEERGHEHDHDQEDLPGDADAGVGGVAEHVADQRVIDHALQPGDQVLQHRRPGQPPDSRGEGTFDEGTIELLRSERRGHRGNSDCIVRVHGPAPKVTNDRGRRPAAAPSGPRSARHTPP